VRALVYGLAVAGASTVRALLDHGHDVVVADDAIDAAKQELAGALGVDLLPGTVDPRALASQFDLVSPSPGVPEHHDIIVAAHAVGVPVVSEIELAYRWEQVRLGGPRPILAITGTDGKTTTTDLTVAILRAAGHRAEALGNTDTPMVEATGGELSGLDVLVVECTSFRLAWTDRFRADAAVWLNIAPDHLNWHSSMATYTAAKARIFELQSAADVAIGFVDDPVVMEHLRRAPGRRRSFGATGADYHLAGDTLTGPRGPIADVASMRRALPHDVTNALAASALVLETGLADVAAIGHALAEFEAQPHRLEPIGRAGDVEWYNDSKATTPHAASAAIRAFESLVLIAGGSRKGVDLAPMAAEATRVRAVVAIGEAAPDVRAAFDDATTVVDAASMEQAVELAATFARAGDAVVLSPGCASFDWYSGYPERGDHFRDLVRTRLDQRAGDPHLEATT
jgi:UDP-N-acetylmuramoylalanine--D-glutamate ligase